MKAQPSLNSILLMMAVVLMMLRVTLGALGGDRLNADATMAAVAVGLLETGVFGHSPPLGTAVRPTRDVPPGYPAFLAAMAAIDGKAAAALRCIAANPDRASTACRGPSDIRGIVAAQGLAAMACVLLAFLLARSLSGSADVASRWAEFAQILQPTVLTALAVLTSLTLVTVASTRASARPGSGSGALWAAATGAGAAFGVASLLHTPLVYLGLLIGPVLMMVAGSRRGPLATGFLAGLSIVVGPWSYRNAVQFGDPLLAPHFEIVILAGRAAYHAMTWREWIAAFFVWTPTYGTQLGAALFPAETVHRLGNLSPGTIVTDGTARVLASVRAPLDAAASQGLRPLALVLTGHMLSDPLGFAWSLPPLAYRSLWGSNSIIVLCAVAFWKRAIRRHAHVEHPQAFRIALWFLLLFLLFQASTTASFGWNASVLVFAHAYAIAFVTGGLETPRLRRVTAPPATR